jgi:formate-dependent phosphoribosylglycinamide formyltransferase (GAR transformylase)
LSTYTANLPCVQQVLILLRRGEYLLSKLIAIAFNNRYTVSVQGGDILANALAGFYWGTMLRSMIEKLKLPLLRWIRYWRIKLKRLRRFLPGCRSRISNIGIPCCLRPTTCQSGWGISSLRAKTSSRPSKDVLSGITM